MYKEKICEECGKTFIPNSSVQKYCGNKCYKRKNIRDKKRWVKENKEYIKKYRKKYSKKYYQKNKDKLKKYAKDYRDNHREQHNIYKKRWRKENKDKVSKYSRKYLKNHPEKRKESLRKYQQKNKKKLNNYQKKYSHQPRVRLKINKYERNRKKTDRNFKIKCLLKSSLYRALNKYTKTGKIMSSKKYGIDYKAIIEHLKPFPKNLKKYEIHHIKPLHTFNFINKDGSTNLKEVGKAFLPENHRWVTIKEHKKIHNKRK